MLDYFSINERKFSFPIVLIFRKIGVFAWKRKIGKRQFYSVTRRFYSLKLEFGREYKRKKKLNKNLFIFTKNKK